MEPWRIDPNALAEGMFNDKFFSFAGFLPEFVDVTAEVKGNPREFIAVSIDVPESRPPYVHNPVFKCNEADLHPEHLRVRFENGKAKISDHLLAFIRSRAARLVSLSFRRIIVEAAEFEALCKSIAGSSTLRALSLEEMDLSPDGAGILAEALSRQGCKLECLEIRRCRIGTEGMEKLSKALGVTGCKIWNLVIEDSHSERISFDSLGDVLLSASCKLDVVRLSGTGDSQGLFNALASPTCRSLKYFFYFSASLFADMQVKLKSGTKVEWLELHSDAVFERGSLTQVLHFKTAIIARAQVSLYRGELNFTICDELADSKCTLQSLVVQAYRTEDRFVKPVLEALERNYRSRLKVLTFGCDLPQHLEQRRRHILNRTGFFLAAKNEGVVKATIAKLFICGDGEVGKTTIATNLRRSFQVPACFQRHAATQGMHLQMLSYNTGNKLMVCDIAGQAEYHAFHHYFMRGSDRDIFLIVCKVTTIEDVSKRLSYWLRFITSHRSSNPNRKPKVIIALNYFKADHEKSFQEAATSTITNFSRFLEITEDCFHVVATKVNSLQRLRTALGGALEKVLGELPQIPQLCELLETRKANQMSCFVPLVKRKLPGQRVVQIHELLKIVPWETDEGTALDALKFALTCMHDMGKAIYFGADGKDELLKSRTILDVQWFVQELVGKFIKVNRRNKNMKVQSTGNSKLPEWAMRMDDFRGLVESMCPLEHLDFVLKTLEELGVVLRQGNHITVPAMLQETFPGWSQEEAGQAYCHWGRRLECKDKICTLLPSGIFTMIQVHVKTLCTNPSDTGNATSNESFTVGRGWVYFERNDVRVVVRIGGVTGHWEDRYWVDIMVKAQEGNQAGKMMKNVKELVLQKCCDLPKLELEELIINPLVVKQRMSEAGEGTNGGEGDTSVAVPLSGIKVWFKKVLAQQSDEVYHTWGRGERSHGQQLLTVDELEELACEWKAQVSAAYEECIAFSDEDESSNYSRMTSLQRPSNISTSRSESFEELHQRFDDIRKLLVKMGASLEAVHQIVTQTQKFMKDYGDQILSTCSHTLNKLETKYPRYPYFCEGNKLFKYSSVVGTKVKLRYLCEWSKLHHVPGYEGLSLELPHEWFTKYSHVLVPALKAFFLLAKIGGKVAASALGRGDVFDAPIEWAEKGLDKVLDSVLSTELASNRKPPSELELMDLFGKVEDQAIKDRMESKSYVRKTFGLRQKAVENHYVWVCDKCF